MTEKKLAKCPFCVTGEVKVVNVRKHPSRDICDAYDIHCQNPRCNMSLCLAVKKGDTVERVWNTYAAQLGGGTK